MPELRIFLLGPLNIQRDDQQVPKPPTQKSQSLLAYLALHRQRLQSREHLADMFWGDRPERKARRSLTTALWHIRRCLSNEDVLLSDVQSVQFDPSADLWLDVTEFESLASCPTPSYLQSAIALYRGDFMDGFYDDWVLIERYRLDMLYSEALARLMMALEEQGDYESALAMALRLLDHDLLREDAHRLAMRALYRSGHRNAALEQYRHCQEIIKRELRADPMVETTALYQAILDGRFDVESAAKAPTAGRVVVEAVLPEGQNPLDPVFRRRMVGREQEMAFLLDRYEEARGGHGNLVIICGEAGVGKTRLMEEFANHTSWHGATALQGRCYEFERILPYQPVAELLQTALSTMAPNDLAGLPSWILHELVYLVPTLSEKLVEHRAGLGVSWEQKQSHLFEGVTQFLISLSTGGALVLILEDLHWATESTLQMIHYLTRHLAGHPVLIVGTMRLEEVGLQHPFGSFQQQLSCEGLIRELRLSGLSQEAIDELLIEMSGSGQAILPLGRRLFQETEGNPFFLVEILKALFETGLIHLEHGAWMGNFTRVSGVDLPLPVRVSEAIQARVDRLSGDVRDALQVAAVLGREFDFDLLNLVWQQGEEETLQALDALLRRRFIDEGSGVLSRDYVFHHHKIQEVVYAGLSRQQRQHLHVRVGQTMEVLYALDVAAVASELAYHFSQGRREDKVLAAKAIRYLLLAGDQARLAYAHREAIDCYNQALVLQKEQDQYEMAGQTLMKLGLVYHTSFDFSRARQAFEEGFNQWQQAGQRDLPNTLPPAPHALRFRWRCPYMLDPALCTEYVSTLVLQQMFSGLVSTDPTLDVVPEVAQRWQILEGGRRYRFHLRSDARWSDGTPLTAHDFEYAWKRVLDPALGGIPSELLAIRGAREFHQGENADAVQLGIRVLDAGTLDVELEEPVSHFLYALTTINTCPVPRHVIEAFGPAWTDADKIVSNGPFHLETWDRGTGMKLVLNPFYAGRCRGNVEQVVLRFPQEGATQDLSAPLAHYVQGDLDVLTLTDASVHEGDRIRRQFTTEYLSAPWLFTTYLGFVLSRSPVDDVRLRQALALGIDREQLANVILRGMYTPGSGGFIPPGMPGHSPQIGFPYDPERARLLLAAAGYTAGADLLVLDGLSVPPIDPLITEYLQKQWQENLGIQVAWDVADWPPFRRRLQQDPPHLYILARFADWPDPSYFLPACNERHRNRWVSQAYEDLVEQARQALDQKTRIEILRRADQILVHEAPILPLIYGRQHLLVKPWVTSFPISALNSWYWKDTIIEPH